MTISRVWPPLAEGSSKRWFAVLQLIRLPNLFTAMADSLAGYLIVHGRAISPLDLFGLMLASALIYGGGCAINDLCDRELDQWQRPKRPIPSGAVSPRAALLLGLSLLALGLVAAALVSWAALEVAALLVVLVLCYDGLTKEMPVLGSLTMAACRGGNLLLGMVTGGPAGVVLLLPLISMGYVFGLTALSKFETANPTPHRARAIVLGLGAGLALPAMLVWGGYLAPTALVGLVVLVGLVGLPLGQWLRRPGSVTAGRAVTALVLGVAVLDAVYVLGRVEWWLALPVVGCSLLAWLTARSLAVH